jgi:RNA polymerase sigma factor (sigma-70 family)
MSYTDEEQSLSTELLNDLRTHTLGDRDMFALLQKELKRRARKKMASERPDHTLQATALINEAFVRIFRNGDAGRWESEGHAINAISLAIERILIDHAAARVAAKRGGKQNRVALDQGQSEEFGGGVQRERLDEELLVEPEQSERVLGVREALSDLEKEAPRRARVVRLQFYGGLTQEEIAAILGVSTETVKLDWKKAREYLKLRLSA